MSAEREQRVVLMRPRNLEGEWRELTDPTLAEHKRKSGFEIRTFVPEPQEEEGEGLARIELETERGIANGLLVAVGFVAHKLREGGRGAENVAECVQVLRNARTAALSASTPGLSGPGSDLDSVRTEGCTCEWTRASQPTYPWYRISTAPGCPVHAASESASTPEQGCTCTDRWGFVGLQDLDCPVHGSRDRDAK